MNLRVDGIYRFVLKNDMPDRVIFFEEDPHQAVLEVNLPKWPDKKDIAGARLPTSKQKFSNVISSPPPEYYQIINNSRDKNGMVNRNLLYQEFWGNQRKYKRLDDFINQEWDRRLNGFWFYNNGVPVYMTGTHYFYCRWWNLDVGLPEFRDRDVLSFYHWDLVVVPDPLCLGEIYMKHRREGATYRAQCKGYKYVTERFEAHGGIQSKTDTDASVVFSKKLVRPWRKLPFFFQPITSSSTNPGSSLDFTEPRISSTKDAQFIETEQKALNSWIDFQNSKSNAYDSDKLHFYHLDEPGKTTTHKVSKTWSVARDCMTTGADGKACLTSTVEELLQGGGAEFKYLWDGSDRSKKDMNGQTATKLYSFYLPAQLGLEIEGGKRFYNEFGVSDTDAANQYLDNKIEGLRAAKQYKEINEEKRKYPRSVPEAFMSGMGNDYFNSDEIARRLERYTFGNPDVRVGNFIPYNSENLFDGVYFKESENGRFKVSKLFDDPKESNRNYRKGNIIIPSNKDVFIAGADPFKYNNTATSRQSMGGGAVKMMRNYQIDPDSKDISEWETDRFVCTYSARPLTKDLYARDMAMACIYYGCMMFPEVDVDLIWDWFISNGMAGYLLYGKTERNRLRTTPGANTNNRLKEQMFGLYGTYLERNVYREVHDDLLKQANEVHFDTITDYDLFVAGGYALLGEDKLTFKPKKKEPEVENKEGDKLFDTFVYMNGQSIKA